MARTAFSSARDKRRWITKGSRCVWEIWEPQIAQTFDNLETVLRGTGLGLSDMVRLNYCTTDVDRFFEAQEVAATRLVESGCRPSATLLGW